MKNYVICASLDEDSLKTLTKLRYDIDLKNATIHIVTIVEVHVYNMEFAPYVYPAEYQYPEIQESSLEILKNLAKTLDLDPEKVIIKCFFDHNREEKIKDYLEQVHADLVVTATRGKHGLAGFFSSSFTDYLCKFSPCDVLAIRPSPK